jgi:molybdate transport system substrate-binding protein
MHGFRERRVGLLLGLFRAVVALSLSFFAFAFASAGWADPGSGAAGADGSPRATPHRPLRVFAAASLTEVIEGLAKDFAGSPVVASFGASGDLARQIADGAPADVFVSASPEWVDFLEEAKAVAGPRVLVARNALVCVTKQGSAISRRPVADPKALLSALAPGDLVAIADEGVPAGEYARASLAKLGLVEAFESRLVGQKDVRAVLHAVEQGEVAAGFVYATDAKVAARTVASLFAFDPSSHPPIEYHAVLLRQAESPAASAFVRHLGSPAARARLSQAGFVLP